MALNNLLNGYQLIDGTSDGFNVADIEGYSLKTIYFIRTNSENNDGYIHFNGKDYGTSNDTKQELMSKLGTLPDGYDDFVSFVNQSVEEKTRDVSDLTDSVLAMLSSSSLKFYCVEPVAVTANDEHKVFPANSSVNVNVDTSKPFSITTNSDNSIQILSAYPGAISTFYSWLNGVQVFDGILFDMNTSEMYEKWNQGNQLQYRVQQAQYNNCIFWSDLAYVQSPVELRTNYTLYRTAQLPLCFSFIKENTYKPFYCPYGVVSDPNWGNPDYINSFAMTTIPTQPFSYYGNRTIGIFNMDHPVFNIPLPADCRGLCFYSPLIENLGILDAAKTTNFGAKSGSWRDAFGYCTSLKNLYIKNLHCNLNVSWSPITQDSLNYILSYATNTSKITISLSPHTYHSLLDTNKSLAAEKNITLALITTNMYEDNRLNAITIGGDGTKFLSNDGTYKTLSDSGYLTIDSPELFQLIQNVVQQSVSG